MMYREGTAETGSSFNTVDYVLYLRRRWRFAAIACGTAAALALAASLLMPKRYTSTASLLIEPPAATDPRMSTAISPVYLESLKTYEHFAMSDSLFAKARERFGMKDPAGQQSIETLKRRVLKVSKVRDTKVLRISVTLENPKEAQAMAQYLAEETIKLSSAVTRDSGRSMIEDAERQAREARAKLEEARAAWTKLVTEEPVESLQMEVESLVELQYRLQRNAAEAQAGAAEYRARARGSSSPDREMLEREAASLEARGSEFSRREQETAKAVAEKSRLMAQRLARRQALEAQRGAAQAGYDAVNGRLLGLRGSVGVSGERLEMIDSGIVPERPSEPRTSLNVLIAVAVAGVTALIYLSLAYNFRP
jgi:uncharacterized protein involved in exopolysaccharide biosynthesis